MTILVTGGGGFIGSNLVDKLLLLGYKVICIDNFDPFYNKSDKLENLANALKNKDFTLIEGDINDQNALDRCFRTHHIDIVVHLAAKAGVRPSIENPIGYYETNVNGTLNLLEVMRINKITKLIFASSSSVYGNNNKIPFCESDLVDKPISPYAASKRSGELLCHTYHHLYGFDVFCLRFFTVFGPRQRPDLAIHKFTNLAIQNKSIPIYGNGSSARDYTYIDDIIDGIIKSINHLKGYQIINLGESRTINLIELITILEGVMNKKIAINHLPLQVGDVDITYADISKSRNLIGYDPKWDFKEGIKAFINWKMGNIKL